MTLADCLSRLTAEHLVTTAGDLKFVLDCLGLTEAEHVVGGRPQPEEV